MNNGDFLNFGQALKMLGFLDDERKILICLFNMKKASAKDISKHSAVSFSTCHYLLTNLVRRGLVKCHHEKEEFYEICTPKQFINWIKEKKRENEKIYETSMKNVESYLTHLQNADWKPKVTYYEGRKGIIEIYKDMITTGKDIYCWTDLGKVYETLGDYTDEFIKKRTKANITTHAIKPKTKSSINDAKEKGRKRKLKLIDNLAIEGEIRIYGDKVAVITLDKQKPIGFVLNGKVITKLFKAIFDCAWSN